MVKLFKEYKCDFCGKSYTKRFGRQKYCERPECYFKRNKLYHEDYMKKYVKRKEVK